MVNCLEKLDLGITNTTGVVPCSGTPLFSLKTGPKFSKKFKFLGVRHFPLPELDVAIFTSVYYSTTHTNQDNILIHPFYMY